MLKKVPGEKTFVDVGCGPAELACTLAEKGYSGVGLDFSKNALEAAEIIRASRNISPKKLEFKLGGLEQIKKQSFQIVISCEVLEHIEDDVDFLNQLCDIDANYYILSVPARQEWFDEFDTKVGHYRRYEKDDLIKLFNEASLDIVEFSSYGYPVINVTRLIRKALANKVKKQKSKEESTKASGINPIKPTSLLAKFDMENIIKPFYYLSLPFNRFNLSEGYLVLCKKRK
ncbi:class I SAM-dependent methyltransferase [Candidatus Parcubacteria bacterium]|nr:class I SAM-dependent methyltransferase [Candidatus Parcubacteria bacterium]